MTSNFERDELAQIIAEAADAWLMHDHRIEGASPEGRAADEVIKAGYRKIFDGDGGLSAIKAPDDREAAEAWMRWANLAMDDSLGAIGAMKQMLTEFGYRKPRLIQYVVVSENGLLYDCGFGDNRDAAQAVADQATADARTVAAGSSYRVAALVEA